MGHLQANMQTFPAIVRRLPIHRIDIFALKIVIICSNKMILLLNRFEDSSIQLFKFKIFMIK